MNALTQTMEPQTLTAPHVLNIILPGAMDMIRTHSFQVKCAASVEEVLKLIVTKLQIVMKTRLVNALTLTMEPQT